jgi:SWI/SNF-related matrix-associated actin-dependent regulator of chromatin subfamily A3
MSLTASASSSRAALLVATSESSQAEPQEAAVASPIVLDLTQDEPADETAEEDHVLIGSCSYTVVGIRYYQGVAHPGEFVDLKREPSNPYDRNAIRVDNMRGEKVGHIKKEQASILAPIMDSADREGLKLEGIIPSRGNQFQLPLSLKFYAVAHAEQVRERAASLIRTLNSAFRGRFGFKLRHQPPGSEQSGRAAASAPEVETKKLNWQAQAQELDDIFEKQSKQQLLNLPEISFPPELTTTLLDYQKKGVRWLVKQESNSNTVPFFKEVTEKGRKVRFSFRFCVDTIDILVLQYYSPDSLA